MTGVEAEKAREGAADVAPPERATARHPRIPVAARPRNPEAKPLYETKARIDFAFDVCFRALRLIAAGAVVGHLVASVISGAYPGQEMLEGAAQILRGP